MHAEQYAVCLFQAQEKKSSWQQLGGMFII